MENDTSIFLSSVWQSIRNELQKFDMEGVISTNPAPLTSTQLKKDPFDGSESNYCEWRCDNGRLLGHMQIFEEGKVYAEYDILLPHPNLEDKFIESVVVWGKPEKLKAELKLLEAAE